MIVFLRLVNIAIRVAAQWSGQTKQYMHVHR